MLCAPLDQKAVRHAVERAEVVRQLARGVLLRGSESPGVPRPLRVPAADFLDPGSGGDAHFVPGSEGGGRGGRPPHVVDAHDAGVATQKFYDTHALWIEDCLQLRHGAARAGLGRDAAPSRALEQWHRPHFPELGQPPLDVPLGIFSVLNSQRAPTCPRCAAGPGTEAAGGERASAPVAAPPHDPVKRRHPGAAEGPMLVQPSVLRGRRPSVFFQYPPATGLRREEGPGTPAPPLGPRRGPAAPLHTKVLCCSVSPSAHAAARQPFARACRNRSTCTSRFLGPASTHACATRSTTPDFDVPMGPTGMPSGASTCSPPSSASSSPSKRCMPPTPPTSHQSWRPSALRTRAAAAGP